MVNHPLNFNIHVQLKKNERQNSRNHTLDVAWNLIVMHTYNIYFCWHWMRLPCIISTHTHTYGESGILKIFRTIWDNAARNSWMCAAHMWTSNLLPGRKHALAKWEYIHMVVVSSSFVPLARSIVRCFPHSSSYRFLA